MPALELLLQRLIAHKVDFVVVGGFAAVAYGASLVTKDVDICCRMSPQNLLRLQSAVADLHPVHRMTPQRIPLDLSGASFSGIRNLYLDTDIGPLDCLGDVLGIGGYDEVFARSKEIDLGSGPCRILEIGALIQAKEAMGRPHDKQTAIQLRAIREHCG